MVLWTVKLMKKGDRCSGEDVKTLDRLVLPNHSGKVSERVKFQWLMPCEGEVKANTVGSVQDEPLAVGIGVSFKTKEGEFFTVIAMRIESTEIVWTEGLAIMRAAEIVVNKGWSKVWKGSDSAAVVTMFKQSKIPWNLLGRWRRCLQWLHSIRISHIWREANLVADQAAKYATTLAPNVEVRVDQKPEWITQGESSFFTYERLK